MRKPVLLLLLSGLLGAVFLFAAACASETDLTPLEQRVTQVEGKVGSVEGRVAGVESKVGKVGAPAGAVEFVVTGVEWKGATSTNSLAAPSTNPKDLSDGYRYKAPGEFDKNDSTRWEVSSYVWTPGAMTVLQGDTVTLRIFIVNGDKHTTWVECPDGTECVKEQEQNRGREYVMTFAASQVGTYTLICNEHDPTMRAVITVLPRSS